MNKTALTIGVIVVLLIIGGLIYYANQSGSVLNQEATTTATETPTVNSPSTSPQPGRPVVVTSQVVAVSDTTAIASGSINPRGALTSYWYEYGKTANLGSKTATQIVGSGFATLPAPGYIINLAKDTTYYFHLVAENQYGRVSGATFTFHTSVGTPPPVGSAPAARTTSASSITRTAAIVNGEVTPNKAATQYWFEYGTTRDLGQTTALVSAGDGSSAVAAHVQLLNLAPATTYYFRLNAQNQFGVVNGGILSFTTTGPPAPTAPTVSVRSAANVTATMATLRGNVNANAAATIYWFEYSTDPQFGSAGLNTTAQIGVGDGTASTAVSANVRDLATSTTYYFRLVAQNSVDVSRSDSLSFRTK